MKKPVKRIFVYPHDIQMLSGKGERYARSSYQKIKKHFNLEPHQLVTITQLAQYFGLSEEKMHELLK